MLGYIQRGGTPSPIDRILATRYGAFAAELIAKKKFGNMVAIINDNLVPVPLKDVANKTKFVPADYPMIKKARYIGTSFGD